MQSSQPGGIALSLPDSERTTDYRGRLYRSYVTTHLGTYRPVNAATMERDRRLFSALYRRLLPARRDARILEIGCGSGSFLHFLKAEGYVDITGIDVSEEQVAVARSAGVGDIEAADALPYLDDHPAAYDLIVAFDVIEHFSKDEALRFLDGVHNALRSGGVVLLRTPNADSPFHSWIRYADFTHELAFTPASIRQVLRATGFTDIRVMPLEPYVHGPASAARWLLWKAVKQLIKLYMLIEQGTAGSGVFTANLCAVARKADEPAHPDAMR
jgi:cyclopropane fatty-acyl-phospholipid synthase-like methyltransferase